MSMCLSYSWLTRNNVHRRRYCFGNITLDQLLWPTIQGPIWPAWPDPDMQFSSGIGVNSWETAANSYTQCILPQMNCKTFVIYYQKTRKDAQKLSPLLQKNTLTVFVFLVCPGDEHELNVCCTCCIYRGPNNTWRMEPMNLPLTPGIQTHLERFVESWGWMVWFSSLTYMNGRWFLWKCR